MSVKNKLFLIIGDLLKGRKADAIGTVKDVPGTKYKRVRMATGWQHVKVAPNGDLIDSSGAVLGNYSGTGKATMVSASSTKRQGRGRPTGTVKTQPAPAGTPAKGRGRPRKVPLVTAPVQVKAPAKKININKNKTVTKPVAPVAPVAPTAPTASVAPDIPPDIDWTFGDGDSGLPAVDTTVVADPATDTTTVIDTATAVQAGSTPDAPKKEKKIKDKPDKDVAKVGDRVLRKNKNGTMYWSVKQADGTWAYDGIATPSQIQAWKLGEFRRKKAERQRAEHDRIMAEREKNKNKKADDVVVVSVDPDWNVDGTPTASGLAKMQIKEKLYWTEASERARSIADKCGILCLDKTAEDYVENKLDTVFKTSAIDKKVIDAVKADIPLDFDGKFADDPVFMQDTLVNLKTYLSAVKSNEAGYVQMIYDKIIAEGYPHGISARTNSQDKYEDLVRSVETWISKIENQDKDRIALATLRDFDEQVAAVREVGKVPTLAIRAVFGKDIDDLINSNDSMNKITGYNAIPAWEGMFNPGVGEPPNKVIELLHSVGFDDRLIADYVVNDRYSNNETLHRRFVGLLATVLSPSVDAMSISDWFGKPGTDSAGRIENKFLAVFNVHKFAYQPSSYGVNERYRYREPPAGLTAESFVDNAKDARIKYKALSEFLGDTTNLTGKIPVNTDEVFKVQASHTGGFVLNHPYGMKNSVIADHIKKFRKSVKKDSVDGDSNITIMDSIATAMSGELKDESFDILPQVLERLFAEKHSKLSENMRAYVKVPEKRSIINEFKSIAPYYGYSSSASGAPEGIDPTIPAERNKTIGRAGLKSKQYRVHYSLKGMVEYSNMTRDSGRGGLKRSEAYREVIGENAALKSAIKASWSDLTVIPTVATYQSYSSKSDKIGVGTHAEASLAVAIGLNWQLRKLTKKGGIIPNWKWFEGTKPFEPKNKFSVVAAPKIDDVTVTSRSRYRRGSTYTYSGRGGGSMKESEYREMLQNAKNEVLAVELGLSEAKKTDPSARPPAPKIALKTSSRSLNEWDYEMRKAWTHDRSDLPRGDGFSPNRYKITSAFDILYPDYQPAYDEQVKTRGNEFGKNKPLFTGTDFVAGANIMKVGAQVGWSAKAGNMLADRPEHVIHGGQDYNTGTYVSTSFSKTLGYMNDKSFGHGTGVVFKLTAAMGAVSPDGDFKNYHGLKNPDGSYVYDTIFGHGFTGGNIRNTARLDHDEHYVRPPKGFGQVRANDHRVNPVIMPTQWLEVTKN